ncbi:MAG: FtsW/RodA/SpoVE family cell cycle protein, partial [Bdellovibrionales bacterium]
MRIENRTTFKKFDINLALVILFLNAIGLFSLYSATHHPDSAEISRTFLSQLVWLGGAWIIYLVVSFIDYKLFQKIAYAAYGINLFALALVPFIGKSFYGAQRWLDFGFFRYQPSETMKLALVLVLAKVLANKNTINGLGVKDLVFPLTLTVVPFVLIAKQPDLGTALMLFAMGATMCLFVGVKRRVLLSAVSIVIIALPLAWSFALKPYQKQRVLTFLDPGRDPRGAGYNSIQSKIAVGSGQWVGKGF